MALRHAALDDVAQAIQLAIEYDPQPPFDAGSPSKAPGHVVERVRAAAARNAVECPASATAELGDGAPDARRRAGPRLAGV